MAKPSFPRTQVTADLPMSFYLIVTPGLEEVAEAELREWLPELGDVRRERGGLSFETGLAAGFELNRALKTPTRILLRLAEFGCRDFPKLFKKMNDFPWQDWVFDKAPVEFRASSHGSRVKMKKRIEETCAEARAKNQKARGKEGPAASDKEPLQMLVRLENDVCTVSLDTSGEILHKRGERPLVGDAPLRETSAAALLRLLAGAAPVPEGGAELVDPMMGSGVFLLEAASLGSLASERAFAFETLVPLRRPGWKPGRLERRASGSPFAKLVGYEQDEKTFRAAKENLSAASIAAELKNEDFFAAAPLDRGRRERWVIANPPYGERLKVEGRLRDYYLELARVTEKSVAPGRVCFLLPEKVQPEKLPWPREWRLKASRRFSNGGIPVAALVFARA